MDAFISQHRFSDSKNYPRGFSRHGDFSRKEAELLETYGYAFNQLDSGKCKPTNEIEANFIAVCRGECEPHTDEECVWLKYLHMIKSPKKKAYMMRAKCMKKIKSKAISKIVRFALMPSRGIPSFTAPPPSKGNDSDAADVTPAI